MLNSDTEILFPIRVIPSLRNLRGEEWQALIDRLTTAEAEEIWQGAFSLMMVRLGGCAGCNADSFRAMRGCTHCAQLTVKRFKGSDDDLLQLYRDTLEEVIGHLAKYELIEEQ